MEARRNAACRAFWSDQPLNVHFRATIGDRPFSLREFVGFVVALPADLFEQLTQDDRRTA